MHVGSDLKDASLEQLAALPDDAANYRIIVVAGRIYFRKTNGTWGEIYTDQNTENLPIIAVGDNNKIVKVNAANDGYELSNSNITLTSPTITNKISTGTDSGAETLENKTLTTPTLNTPVVNTPQLNGTATTNSGLTLPETGFAAAKATPTANKMVNEAIIKAWGYVKKDGTIMASYNVDSVSVAAAGSLYDITLKTAFSDTNYIVISMSEQNASADSGANMTLTTKLQAKTSSVFRLQCSDTDMTYFYFIAIGAQ
jgi:hypothetical protein